MDNKIRYPILKPSILHRPTYEKGFTLLEVSVAIGVIAILVASIVGGAALISSAKSNRILKDIQDFADLTSDFEQRYGSLPGDISYFTDHYPAEASASNGDNDAFISDTNDEDLYFWRHLRLSGLLTSGTYDGATRFVPGVGVPEGPYAGSGYKVRRDRAFGLYFELAGYSTTSDSLGILTPAEARKLDERVDDGDPNAGRIRGTGANCVSAGNYDTTNDNQDCILQIIAKLTSTTIASGAAASCSDGGVEGEVRIVQTESCPSGYEGKVVRVCQNDGSWETEYRCEIIQCYGQRYFQETREVFCPSEYVGTMTEICEEGSLWQELTNTCALQSGDTCSSDRTVACPLGYTGNQVQVCTSGTYGATTNNCTKIQCSGGADVGDLDTSIRNCASPFTSGTYTTVCSFDTTVGAEWKAIGNTCQAADTCLTSDSPMEIDCPDGENGQITLECPSDGANWITVLSTCTANTCGGEPIGSYRFVEEIQCSAGNGGIVLEICDEDGTWIRDEANCLP